MEASAAWRTVGYHLLLRDRLLLRREELLARKASKSKPKAPTAEPEAPKEEPKVEAKPEAPTPKAEEAPKNEYAPGTWVKLTWHEYPQLIVEKTGDGYRVWSEWELKWREVSPREIERVVKPDPKRSARLA